MLSEFENVERSFGAEKAADLRKAQHFLLRRQFVFAGDPRTGTVYNTIMDGRFRDVVDGFFDSCGYRVHRDPEAQWAGIVAMDEDVPLPRMKLDETIVMLVLAAYWQQEVNVGAVEDRAVVVATLNDLFDRYREMAQHGGGGAISAARFRDILREVAQRSLVEIGDFDDEQQDCEIRIRPMIKLISGGDALQRLERYVRSEEARFPQPTGGEA
ncbi:MULTISPECIES: DUF4194 domain-containing protein [Bradyrhizobium]|uniref:Uncharacterized protein n=1 Tax=Bradyrhizobium japonicum TaxID=375 RepID=A0A0A3Z5M7_BRAJP|nr:MULTISPECIES: DUF4194 domain-containing protein [Bradyrhizobium]AJA65462.1 hypothetical protein RN69_38145 [Bradyrhizobium japonicum]KGT81188.1 hypothetical protein MA20_03365 [Bradyrhizobium japonicum]KMJ94708.1 hypothetical protein CF64_35125 [Bradyrhizobium japonicum]MCS3537428.1 hypothetical protein [Bradyrhizobium japonicum]MCS3899294.1 hypothetical protein [Bradyrhizobium japonicum USDA 38]